MTIPTGEKVRRYRETLKGLGEWRPFLLDNSGLPGPRGNLELAAAVAAEGGAPLFIQLAALSPEEAPTGTPGEFLVFCGVLGLGSLVAGGEGEWLDRLMGHASDPRWRVREAAAMALQRVGESDADLLLRTAEAWSLRGFLPCRAAVAGVCEPAFLVTEERGARVVEILDTATRTIAGAGATERKSEPFRVLRQGLGYAWSVAVAACPERGKDALEAWLDTDDPDVAWLLRENLKKKRLQRADPAWVAAALLRVRPAGRQAPM